MVLHTDIAAKQIILASSSPRRRELMAGLGIDFTVQPSLEDEDVPAGTAPAQMVEMLSLRKAQSSARGFQQGLVIGSDTIVVLNDRILGKPSDENDAFSMLSQLQGRIHTVYSGVAVVEAGTGKYKTAHQFTKVKMRTLSEEKIRRYIKTGEPMDKAGAYAIQGLGATLVESIEGDYFTVVGLPLSLLSDMLAEFGVEVL
jgi:septum formation protein